MTRRPLSLAVALACTCLFSIAAARAADFTGTWKGSVEFPDGQQRELTYNLKVDGGKLTGTIESPRGKIEIADGKVSGDSFSFNTMRDGNPIAHEGKWADGKIKITVHTPGGDREYSLAAAPATDKPAADASAMKRAPSASNITGQWKGSINDQNGNPIDLVYDFKADGTKLTGTVEGPAGKLPLEEGAIDGDKLKFQISFGDFHIKHDGALADGKIKLTSHMPDKDREYTIAKATSGKAADVAGAWESKFTGQNGNEMVTKYDFKVDGDKLTGTMEGRRGKVDIQDGKIDGDKVSFKVKRGDNDITYEGSLVDGKLQLKSHGSQFGDRDYSLTRPAKAASDSIAGDWEASFKDDTGNDLPLKFDLKLDGEKISGTVKTAQGDGKITSGAVKGDDVSFDVEFNGETIKHKGKLTDGQIKLKVNGFGTEWDLTLTRPAAK